ISGDDLAKQNPIDLSDLLYRNLGSVNISGTQSNPWQNDVTYRGFLASPLTGSAIGLSVYLDGMRFNHGLGDTVNWDLILTRAIAAPCTRAPIRPGTRCTSAISAAATG